MIITVQRLYTVLCKSNANEIHKFHSLFLRIIAVNSHKKSCGLSRHFERYFSVTIGDITSSLRDLNESAWKFAKVSFSLQASVRNFGTH